MGAGRNTEQQKLYNNVTAVVLAGGLSRRYGENKAFLEIDGVQLIENIVREMKQIFHRVILVANDKNIYEYLGVTVINDRIKGLGPLGGIYTGLLSISDQAGFFVACDMPYINRPLIRYMVENRGAYAAVVPSASAGIEPLHAIYAKSCLGPIEDLIISQRYQARLFLENIPVRWVTEDEIKRFVSPQIAFFNINTPNEFAKAQSLIKK